jgi:ribosomal protein S18 acetylase RimI-like enzyme
MLSIDLAQPADIPALTDLLAILFTQEAEMRPDRSKQIRGLEQILATPAVGQIFVAREKDAVDAASRVLGMVSLLFTISTAEGGPACWLEDLIVRPDARDRGIGSQLLSHAIHQAQSRGCYRLTLLTDHSNTAAQRLYARHGFAPSEMRLFRLHLRSQ